MTAPTSTPIEPGLVSRVAQGLRHAFAGKVGEWFGPSNPIAPAQTPEQAQQSGVAGRQLDYATGFNVVTTPRYGEAITFPVLRGLADRCDILRLVIETRKDQVCSLPWQVMPRQVNGTRAKPGPDVLAAEAFLRKPDREHDWPTWLRLLLEDLFVLDAPAIYVRKTLGGGDYGYEPIDGATIKRIIDDTGRTPEEGPAYQQVLKGIPAVDYTTDELIYRPRNPRTNKVYGYGPVEQIINTVNVALRRAMFTQDYFTSGTVPDALAGVPETWNTDQIAVFQKYWDGMLAAEDANMAPRRKLRFVPGEIARNFKETKQPPLKDMFDEWLARIICYCFSIDVTPFVAQVNRSVAETNRQQSLEEGLGPIQQWVKAVADDILARQGWGTLELVWQEGEMTDPEKRQKVLCGYVTAKVLHPDEARAKLGYDPFTPEQKEDLAPPPPVAPVGGEVDDGGGGGKPPPGKPKAKKGDDDDGGASLGKALRPSSAGRKALLAAQDRLATHIETFLKGWGALAAKALASALSADLTEVGKASSKSKAKKAVDALPWDDWDAMAQEANPFLAQIAVAAAESALDQVGTMADDAKALIRNDAEQWAKDRAAEMVGKKWVNGQLVDNPRAEWRITDTTRDSLRETTVTALDEGWSAQRFADEIEASASFSESRAMTVARTELANADGAGAMIGYRATGLVAGKQSVTAKDEKVSELCQENADAGIIPLDSEFPSGDDTAPFHPNCRCVVIPVLMREMEGE